MSILSDVRILEQLYEGNITIDPFVYENLQPASFDLTLDDKIKIFTETKQSVIKAYGGDSNNCVEKRIDKYLLRPNEFILAVIREKLDIGRHFTARIENRNSLARLGIDVSLGSFINPGYTGKMTIVIKNNNNVPVEICKGMRICQLVIEDVEPSPSIDYGIKEDAKYQGESGVVPSMLFKDKEYQEFLVKNQKGDNLGSIGDFLIERLENKVSSVNDILSKKQRERLGLR